MRRAQGGPREAPCGRQHEDKACCAARRVAHCVCFSKRKNKRPEHTRGGGARGAVPCGGARLTMRCQGPQRPPWPCRPQRPLPGARNK